MGIQIVSVLADSYSQLATSSGVSLQLRIPEGEENTTKYHHEQIKNLINMWSNGHSRRPATWKQLLAVLRELGFIELSQQIDVFMKGKKRQ